MWSEDMDKKIRAAAGETGLHAYEDGSWQKMEGLLDKHLPQNRKRRRIIFFLSLGLLLTVSGFFIARSFTSSHKTITEQQSNPGATPGTEGQPSNNKTTIPAVPAENDRAANPSPETTAATDPATTSGINTTTPGRNNNTGKDIALFQTGKAGISTKKDRVNDPVKTSEPEINVTPGNLVNNSITSVQLPPDQPAEKKEKAPVIPATDSATAKESITPDKKEITEPVLAKENTAKKQTRKKPAGKISLNFSTGPDISSVGIDRPGQWKMQYGIGLGYAFSDRLSIRTGFYAGRKLYTTDSSGYHLPDYLVNPYYKLQRVKANCFVYEIPVTLVYNFPQSDHHNWFVSAGLSSYLMKKEDYHYTFKTLAGQTVNYDHSYNNENSHLFSVVNLSGGYQYHFSRRFSLLAEPYLKMPVSGIGFGKVKLNSAGVLITVSLRPFAR